MNADNANYHRNYKNKMTAAERTISHELMAQAGEYNKRLLGNIPNIVATLA